MINELETVALTINIPKYNLRTGDVGTVVMVYNNGEAYEVEFIATDGSTIAVETLLSKQVRSTFGKKEIMHLRELV